MLVLDQIDTNREKYLTESKLIIVGIEEIEYSYYLMIEKIKTVNIVFTHSIIKILKKARNTIIIR